MADTLTSIYNFVKIEIGGSNDSWGQKVNDNTQKIEDVIAAAETTISGLETALLDGTNIHSAVVVTDLNAADELGVLTSSDAFDLRKITWANMLVAIKAALSSFIWSTGDLKWCTYKIPASGWLLADGKTIGSALSNASSRADADTLPLFTLLYNNFANAELPIRDASGLPSVRGASALIDFNSNKQLPVPDLRGRTIAGWEGAVASLLTSLVDGSKMGSTGGSQNHILTSVELPAHQHAVNLNATTASAGDHTHTIAAYTGAAGDVSATYGFASSPTSAEIYTKSAGAHTHTVAVAGNTASTGADQNHNNTQPTIVMNAVIKL
jgi:microcystin-dependent protein